jgi:phage terminase large subunit GpA-like protein
MEMLRGGDWKPDSIPTGRVRSVGFHLNSIYSPWLTFGDVAAKFISVKDTPEDLMNFINSWLAEPWEQKASRMKSDIVLSKQLSYERGRVHEDAQLLTIGIDVQLTHFWWSIRGWGPGITSWLVDYGRSETWAEIEEIINRNYVTTQGEIRQINLACIDSGFNTDEVYQFCARNPGVCLPTKGSSHAMNSRYRVTIIDKGIGCGLRLYLFDTCQFKDFIAGRLSYDPGTQGAWHVFSDTEREYADQMCAEQKVEVKNGSRITYEWQKISSHAQNHFLDCETNNTLAAEILGVRYLVKQDITPIREEKTEDNKEEWLKVGDNWL